jgi:hypothetical protein
MSYRNDADASVFPPVLISAFSYYFNYSEFGLTKFQLDLFAFERFRWFWGLTRDFWAENAKNKCK